MKQLGRHRKDCNSLREGSPRNRLGHRRKSALSGPKTNWMNRPIIVKFLSFKSKDEVLHNAFKLKNVVVPKVQISEDFSRKVQFAREKLWDFAFQFRECKTRYKISFDKLYVNDSTYVYDHASGSVVSVRGPNENTMPHEWHNKRELSYRPATVANFSFPIATFRSILSKQDEFESITSSSEPDIILGTETWLTSDISN